MTVQSLDQGRSLKEEMATHFSILAWEIPCTEEEPGRLQSIGLQKVGHDGSNLAHMRHPLIKLFHLSNLLQMPNDHRMVDIEFFSNFVCSYEDQCQWWLAVGIINFQMSRLSTRLQNFLNHHCTVCSLVVPEPNVLLRLQAVSAALWTILNSNKKMIHICFLSNISSIV